MSDNRVVILDGYDTLVTAVSNNTAFMPHVPPIGSKVRVGQRLYLVQDVISEYLDGGGIRVEVRVTYSCLQY